MIRVAIRQLRPSAGVAGVALAALVIVLALTGPHLAHLYDTSGLATCDKYQDCTELEAAFLVNDAFLEALLNFVVLVVPALIGIFFGAPLVAHELESGTYRLAWSQSVTRTRWLLAKLGVVGLASVLSATIVSVGVSWWSSPIDRVNMNAFSMFDHRDLVPVAYTAFAFALGTTLGMLLGRTLPAMAATLAGFVGLRLAVFDWIRPHLESPARLMTAFQTGISNWPGAPTRALLNPADWIISAQTVDAAGHVIGSNSGIGPSGNVFSIEPDGHLSLGGVGVCRGVRILNVAQPGSSASGPGPATLRALHSCITSLHLRELLIYQPANRYWPFQLYETGIFVGAALLLSAFCLWWLHYRLA